MHHRQIAKRECERRKAGIQRRGAGGGGGGGREGKRGREAGRKEQKVYVHKPFFKSIVAPGS